MTLQTTARVARRGGHFAALRRTASVAMSSRSDATGAAEDFGYTKVPPGQKQERVKGVFSSVADQYDVMNDLMSGGIHRLWKDEFVSMIGVGPTMAAKVARDDEPLRCLDVAGGTGDIAFRILGALDRAGAFPGASPPKAEMVISDINPDMLAVGKTRAMEQLPPHMVEAVSWKEINAEEVPFDDATFDLYTIAFGLRNVTDMDKALREARRVLKPGGRFLCLEFSKVQPAPLQQLYDLYSFSVIPALGGLVANDRESYQYLVESIRMFPDQETVRQRMEQAGFAQTSYTNFTAGVVAVHSGFAPGSIPTATQAPAPDDEHKPAK